MPWRFSIELDDRNALPRYLQIAQAIARDVQRGRLSPGDRIPSSRSLAQQLSVHRNTVKAAYEELAAQGLISTSPSSGTFVSSRLLDVAGQPSEDAPPPGRALGFDLPPDGAPDQVAEAWRTLHRAPYSFTGNDPRLLPLASLARAYRSALRSRNRNLLGYQFERGHPRLVEAVRSMLIATRGLRTTDGLMITRGGQMAVYLAIAALVRPGDVVAVEEPGYAFGWLAIQRSGAELTAIPVDEEGLCVDVLEARVLEHPIRAVFTTPHHQYPTGVTMSPSRRRRLLELASRHRFAIIEDDALYGTRYERAPALPLASADREGVTLYAGSFSKLFAPSLRLGYLAGPDQVLERVSRIRPLIDVCGDGVLELAIAELLEDGEIERHARRLTRVLGQRRDALLEALQQHLSAVLEFRVPSGGTAVWTEVDPEIDVDRWSASALERGVGFITGRFFFLDHRHHSNVLLAFERMNESEMREAVARMVQALPSAKKSRAPRNRGS
jgi:GntR family transcriptional regulator/MocR family aminotransferase